MNVIGMIRNWFMVPCRTKDVALVLSGGGARGYAHIGTIEVLQERGYHITSVAGTSMGAMVGGLFAAGKLNEMKEQVLRYSKKDFLSLMDVALGLDHVASGAKLMALLNDMIGDRLIDQLPVDFCCCATDVMSGEEKVFRDGLLKTAIRASISIPCFFKPVNEGNHIYVDGSVHNTLPLDRVIRHKGDSLVAVNACAPDDELFAAYRKSCSSSDDTEKTVFRKLPFLKWKFSENYMNMAMRVARLTIQNNTQMALRLTPPDICANIPMSSFSLFDFDKGAEIIQYGRDEMSRKLDAFERGRD